MGQDENAFELKIDACDILLVRECELYGGKENELTDKVLKL